MISDLIPRRRSTPLFRNPKGSVATRSTWSYHLNSGLTFTQSRMGSKTNAPISEPRMGVTSRSWPDGFSQKASTPNSYIVERSAEYPKDASLPNPRSRARM